MQNSVLRSWVTILARSRMPCGPDYKDMVKIQPLANWVRANHSCAERNDHLLETVISTGTLI